MVCDEYDRDEELQIINAGDIQARYDNMTSETAEWRAKEWGRLQRMTTTFGDDMSMRIICKLLQIRMIIYVDSQPTEHPYNIDCRESNDKDSTIYIFNLADRHFEPLMPIRGNKISDKDLRIGKGKMSDEVGDDDDETRNRLIT